MSKTKMIAVSPQNWESLRKWGEYGDTMNTIVSKILARVDTLPSSNLNDIDNDKDKVVGPANPTTNDNNDAAKTNPPFDNRGLNHDG
jgi:hypothetical protein